MVRSLRIGNTGTWLGVVFAGLVFCILPPATASAQVSFKPGDINDDGCVDGADYTLYLMALMSFITPSGPCKATYDLNQDGLMTPVDSILFEQYYDQPVACAPPPTNPAFCTTYTSCDVACGPKCNVPENGSGTAELPPEGCTYLTPGAFHRIVDALPPGTELQVNVAHRSFTNITRTPGGSLGGEVEQFDSKLLLQIHGTGALASYQRVLELDAPVEIHTAPKQPGQSFQVFQTDMRSLDAEIVPADSDPDFEMLKITAGTDLGMPSPGSTTLLATNSFDVGSSFDVSYQIEMVGAAGGPLAGYSSTTTGTLSVGTPGVEVPVPATGPAGIAIAAALLTGVGAVAWRRRVVRSGAST